MTTSVTDAEIRQLAETAQPYSLALLWWGPERHMDGAEAVGTANISDEWCRSTPTG